MWECKSTWTRLGTYNQDLTLFPYTKSLEAEIRMLIPLPFLQPPRRRVYLRSSRLKIYATLPRWRRRGFRFINWGWNLVGWILLCYSLRITFCLRRREGADKVWRKALRFWLSEEQKLYKRSFSGPYLLCIHPKAVEPLLEELHKRICGSHTRGRSLSHRALTQEY